MDLMEIGTMLREARERKGLAIDEVEERVKIAQSVIIALEEGNKDRFPHPVYARGFVRSYANLLGLDAQELCAHFAREYPVPTDMEPHGDNQGPRITVRFHDSPRVPLVAWVALALGLVALGLGGWYAYDTFLGSGTKSVSIPASESVAPTTSTPSAPMTMQSPVQAPPLTQMQELTDAEANASAEAARGEAASVNATDVNASAPEAAPADSVVPGNAGAATPDDAAPEADTTGRRRMVVSAHSASWLQARADGKVTDYFLRKGESATLTFAQSLTIKFGNAGGVDLTLDGKAYPFEAKLGEVKTLEIK